MALFTVHLQSHTEGSRRIPFCGAPYPCTVAAKLEGVDCLNCLKAAIRQLETVRPSLDDI